MIRTNEFVVVPRSEEKRELLLRLMDGAASLWNQLTYARRQRFFEGEDIWSGDRFHEEYKGRLGAATLETTARVNDRAWKAFFKRRSNDPSARPPGYWGNAEEGRDLRIFLKNQAYTLQWGRYSRLEITIGQDLKPTYGLTPNKRPRFPVRGDPKWDGKKGELQIAYDELTDEFRAYQSVTVDTPEPAIQRQGKAAALDIGVNTLVACATTSGAQYFYDGQAPWETFEETTRAISDAQSKLPDGQQSSRRIRRLYRRRSARRDHCFNALIRDLLSRLSETGVETIYVGDLTGVPRTTHRRRTNRKLSAFWAYRRFTDRLTDICEERGIVLQFVPEFHSSQECPWCGTIEKTTRSGDTLTCPCGYEGHSDLTAARTLLDRHTDHRSRPMARPVRLQWDNHSWRSTRDAPSWANPNEPRTIP